MKKTGTIQSLNVSPKGFYEGLLLNTGHQTIQVNFPKHASPFLIDGLKHEAKASLEVEPEEPRGHPNHEVFRLVRVLEENEHYTRHPDGPYRFSGRITQLNYALHGEVNGGILDSGDFLHLKPEGAAAVGIKLGLAVEGRGETKPMVNGRCVIEAQEVNGITIERHPAKNNHTK